MAALKDAVVVVSGATGTVGSGIVQRFLQDGASVISPLRSPASKGRLTDHLTAPTDKLHTPVADWGTPEGAAALAQFIREQGLQVDHAVSIAGGMAAPGNVADITVASLAEAVQTKVAGHVLLAQALVPLMRQAPSSSFTLITGLLGEVCPFPGVALTCVSNAAVFGLVKVLQFEAKDTPLRVNELRVSSIIRRHSEAENPGFPGVPAQPATKVGAVLAELAGGQRRDEVISLTYEDLEAVAE